MYDVIKVRVDEPGGDGLGMGWCPLPEVGTNWRVREIMKLRTGPEKPAGTLTPWRIYEHGPTGARISGFRDDGIRFVEASLPRVLHGHNGILIRTQKEIDDAVDRLTGLCREISPAFVWRIRSVNHVELAWHFHGAPNEWVSFYSRLKHPRIERFPIIWREEFVPACIHCPPCSFLRQDVVSVSSSLNAVTWKGVKLQIRLYDKTAQMGVAGLLPSVMRLEFRVSEYLATGLTNSGASLSFEKGYVRYRELAAEFRSFRRTRSVSDGPLDFLLSLRAGGVIPDHDWAAFEAAQSRSTRTRYQQRQKELVEVWENIPGIISRLPTEGPPPAPDVAPPPLATSG